MGNKKPECPLEDKIPQDEWWITQIKPEKKKVSSQKSGTLYDETSDSENSECLSATEDAEVPHSKSHAFG